MESILELMTDESLVQHISGSFHQKIGFPDECPIICFSEELTIVPTNYIYEKRNDYILKVEDEVCQLLSDINNRTKRSLEKAERAMEIIRANKLTGFYLIRRGLVHFPHLLRDFLQIHQEKNVSISEDDMASMFARCIELHIEESLDILLNYHGNKELEIKLLPGKYMISDKLYDKAKNHGIKDKYYDAAIEGENIPYTHLDVVAKERSHLYTGFRDAYHILLYGEQQHLQSLIVRWDLWGDDCTADAAREFFKLDPGCIIESVKYHVNKKCQC